MNHLRIATILLFLITSQLVYTQNKSIDSLITLVNRSENDTNQVNNLYSIARYYLFVDPDKAMEFNNKAIRIADSLKFWKGKALSLDISGIYHQNKGEFDKAYAFYSQSLEIREKINNPKLIATSYNNFGVLNRKKGSFNDSKEYFLKSLAISENLKDTTALSMVYNNLGLVMDNLGMYEESISYHLKALSIREKTGNKNDIASSLNNIGIVFISIKKYDDALEYLKKSLVIKEEIGNKRSLASTFINIGNVYYHLNKYDEALNFFEKGKEVYESIGDKKNLAATISNMSYLARKKGDLQLAKEYNLHSIQIIQEIGSIDQLCSAYNSTSENYFELKDYVTAKTYSLKAKELAEKNNFLPQLQVALDNLYKIHSSLKDYKQANLYLTQYIEVKDSLFNEKNNNQILELKTKYETEKKEKEIAILSTKSIEQELKLEKRNRALFMLSGIVILIIILTLFIVQHIKVKQSQKALILEQKLLRAQMNPHFIFNAISAIQHYIIKNRTMEAASYLSSFAKLMRSILNNSREEFVSLETEHQTLENYLNLQKLRLDGKLDFSINIDSSSGAEDILIPPMLIQPFIENAVEHGILKKPDQTGKIDIRFIEKNKKMLIEITDDGIGREKARQYENSGHKSFATEIILSRISAMNKSYKKHVSFTIIDLKDNHQNPVGTKVNFELPLVLN